MTSVKRSKEIFKTSLSLNYMAKPRGKRHGRRASCFKAQTNVQKKDISDSNIYNGSDDGRNEGEINLRTKTKAGQVRDGSDNSLDDSGVIQDETPIAGMKNDLNSNI